MSLTFWDTVRGTRLADTLIRELPKLTGKKHQIVEMYSADNLIAVKKEMEKKLEEGYTIDQMIPTLNHSYFVIYSK